MVLFQYAFLCYNSTEPTLHDSSNLPNMICVNDHNYAGCPAGLLKIKSYTSPTSMSDAMDQCNDYGNVRHFKEQ